MVLFLASFVIFVYGIQASMLGTILPDLAHRINLSNEQLSYLALSQGLGLALTSQFAGRLMDKWGKKPGIIMGLCATAGGFLLLAKADTLSEALLAIAIVGCGGSIVIVGANAIAADLGGDHRAATLNILNVFVGLGGLATPFIAGNLLGGDAKRIALCGCAIAIGVTVLALGVRIEPKAHVETELADSGIFRDRELYRFSSIILLYTAGEFAIWNWLPKYLVGIGVSRKLALNILSLGFACGILCGRLVAAKIVKKLSPMVTTIAAAVLMGVCTITMLSFRSPRIIAIAVFAAGVSMAPVFPTTIAMIADRYQKKSGTAIGFAITCGFSGLVLSSPIIGALSGANDLHRGLLLVPFLAGLIIVLLLTSKVRQQRVASLVSA